jgi:tetratricopeptide (TPR) repeat protein
MNSWHSWSPNGKWLVFSSKARSPYTQLYLTHIDEHGRSTPPVVLSHFTAPDRAANIPEFVNVQRGGIRRIREAFIDDTHYVRAGDAYIAADHDVDGAIRQYRKALELNDKNAVAHSNLGGLLVNKGALGEGVGHLTEAIRLDPANGSPHYNLGMLRFRQGRAGEAIEHLSAAVRLKPGLPDAHRTLGALLCNRGRLSEGVVHLSQAVRLDPKDPTGQYLLGKAMATLGQIDEAVAHLAAAVALDPMHGAAQHQLGMLMFARGQVADALGHLSSAAQVEADDAVLLRDLALALIVAPEPQLRDPMRAVRLATRACELTRYRAVEPLDVLGMAYAETGRFPEAIVAAEQALGLARRAGNNAAAAQIEARIGCYRQEKPYRPANARPK